jgi:hypothetical protein
VRVIRQTYFILALTLLALSMPGRVSAESEPDTVSSIPGIVVQTSVDQAEVYIGDLITYRITIIHDTSIQLVPPPLGANLGAFDVKDYEPDIEKKLPGGRVQTETKFVLSTFTTGDYQIPPMPVLFTLPDSSKKVVLADAVPIKVRSMLENVGDSADIKPLKAQYEFKRNWMPYYVAAGVAVLLLAVLIYWWIRRRRRRKKGPEEVVDLRPAWEIAFEMLAMLNQTQLINDGRFKEYYIQLTEIVRAYFGRMYRVTVLDMTTEEFLGQFVEMDLPAGLFEQTSAFLKHADLVKFAKYVPESERAESDLLVAHDLVEIVRADYERQQQAQLQLATPSTTDAGAPGGSV